MISRKRKYFEFIERLSPIYFLFRFRLICMNIFVNSFDNCSMLEIVYTIMLFNKYCELCKTSVIARHRNKSNIDYYT